MPRSQLLNWGASIVTLLHGRDEQRTVARSPSKQSCKGEGGTLLGAAPGPRVFPGGAEFFVLEVAFEDAEGRYPGGTWLRLPAGSTLDARSANGCVAYVKTGAVPTLRSG